MNDLTQLMERATDDLQPDVAGLVAGGMARGRRRRTRRRLATGLAAAGTVAAVGVTALLVPSYIGGDERPHGSVPVASQPKQHASSPSVLPSLDALASGRVVAVPAGSQLLDSWGGTGKGFVAASWRVTPADGSGAGQLVVLVETVGTRVRLDPGSGALEGMPSPGEVTSLSDLLKWGDCARDSAGCTRLPDGSRLRTGTAPEPLSGGGDSAIIGAHADLWTAGGLHLSATAYNAMGEKHTATTRADPVLDEHQLAEMLRAAQLG